MDILQFKELFFRFTNFKENRHHPFVCITGDPIIGKRVYIGAFSEINAKEVGVTIGDDCDIASFVSINCADSHLRCIGKGVGISRRPIIIQNNVFIGSHSVVKGGAVIGHHSVIAAGTVVDGVTIPPFSLASGNPMKVKVGFYNREKRLDLA